MKKSELKKIKDDIEHLRFNITMLQQEISIFKNNKRKKNVAKFNRVGLKNRRGNLQE
jgi:uncharacterized membrane protein